MDTERNKPALDRLRRRMGILRKHNQKCKAKTMRKRTEESSQGSCTQKKYQASPTFTEGIKAQALGEGLSEEDSLSHNEDQALDQDLAFTPVVSKDLQPPQLMFQGQSLMEEHSEDSCAYSEDHIVRKDLQPPQLGYREQSLTKSSDSDGEKLYIDLVSAPENCDIIVPELTRTDSVFLTRKSLGCTTDSSVSSIDITEDEYIPDSDESSNEEPVTKNKRRVKTRSSTPFSDEEDDTSTTNSVISSQVSVMKLKRSVDGGRVYNKKHYCLFCSQPLSKMARHLESVHKNEVDVARALRFPKGSKSRKLQLDLLRNRGNHVHNCEVIKAGEGILVPRKQMTGREANAGDYMHCVNCQGLFKRKALWRHMSRCQLAKKCSTSRPGKSKVQSLCAYAQPVPDGVSKKLWELINDMNQDEVAVCIRQDKCIIKFGEHLYNRMGGDKTKHEYIRQKMREAGRLLFHARAGKLKKIEDFFIPANFNHVIQAVKEVSGFCEDNSSFKVPSLALKLGHSLKKMANIVECEAMITGDEEVHHNVKKFKQIYDAKWNESVSACALKTLSESKWNTPELLPFTDDVKKMHMYLDTKRRDFQRKLSNEQSPKNWSNLAKITLSEIILFNRRREGEVSKMSLNAFTLRDTSLLHTDVADALSEMEKKLCHHFKRIEIRGKRGRKVPILLTPDMLASMELLVKHRAKSGVQHENPFMFARPGAETHFRGSDSIRVFAHECGAKHPKTLSSTKLRKHVSTLSKVLNLKDTEMDQLADFLGHDIRIHRRYYRLPEGTLQLAKVSKVLMALEQGRLLEFRGKNLDEINIDPNEKVPVVSDLSESEEEDEVAPQKKARVSPSGSSESRCLSTCTSVSDDEVAPKKKISESPGSSKTKKRKWTSEEIHAVERKLVSCIKSGRVPGKAECVACKESAPETLKERNWKAIKFYVKNRITAYQRENKKKIVR